MKTKLSFCCFTFYLFLINCSSFRPLFRPNLVLDRKILLNQNSKNINIPEGKSTLLNEIATVSIPALAACIIDPLLTLIDMYFVGNLSAVLVFAYSIQHCFYREGGVLHQLLRFYDLLKTWKEPLHWQDYPLTAQYSTFLRRYLVHYALEHWHW